MEVGRFDHQFAWRTDGLIVSLLSIATLASDSIDTNQFLSWMGNRMTDNYNGDDLVLAFKAFDKDGNGFISIPELRFVLCCLGDKLDDEAVDAMLDQADPTGCGSVQYEPFIKNMMNRSL